MGDKTLSQGDLEKNGYATMETMTQIIEKGRGQMPGFGPDSPPFARLNDQQLADVAAYTLDAAKKGWGTL